MSIDIAVVADAANVSQEGKLNITGIFDQINSNALPLHYPLLVLVLKLQPSAGEKGRTHQISVRLIDDDGKIVGAGGPEITITVPNVDGSPGPMHIIVQWPGIVFEKFGSYIFDILINGSHSADIQLRVIDTRNPPLT